MTMFGWFSKTQAYALGFAIYKTVDGKVVRVSEVTDDHRQPSKWPDVRYVGEIVDLRCLRSAEASYEELTDQDIIEAKDLILTDAKHKHAKQDWVSVFAKQVNVRDLFGYNIPVGGKRQQYYGAD